MSGVSPQLVDLRKRIADRIERKSKELVDVCTRLEVAQSAVAELELRREALQEGIVEDKALLENAAPKAKRQKKIKTLGQQIGADPLAGE